MNDDLTINNYDWDDEIFFSFFFFFRDLFCSWCWKEEPLAVQGKDDEGSNNIKRGKGTKQNEEEREREKKRNSWLGFQFCWWGTAQPMGMSFGCLTRVSFVFNFFVIININLILGRCFFFFLGGFFLVLRIFRRSKWVMTHEFLCDY